MQLPANFQELLNSGLTKGRGLLVPTGVDFPYISCGKERFTAVPVEGDKVMLGLDSFEFILVDWNPAKTRTYFDGPYDPANTRPPVCWSNNGQYPHPAVPRPQSQTCASCEQSAWGSAKSNLTGEDIPACSESMKLLVYVLHDDIEGLFMFKVPPASMVAWAKYFSSIARLAEGAEPTLVITRAIWSSKKQNTIDFEISDWLTSDLIEFMLDKQGEQDYSEWIGMDPVSQAVPQLTHITPRQIEHAPQAPQPKTDTRERAREMARERTSPPPRQRQQQRPAERQHRETLDTAMSGEPEAGYVEERQEQTAAPVRPRGNGGATGPAPKSAFDIARQRAVNSRQR